MVGASVDRNVKSEVVPGALVPCEFDRCRGALGRAVMPCDRRAFCGWICPEMRSATRPRPRNSVPAIFFPAAAPLLAQQQDRHTPSSACAAA